VSSYKEDLSFYSPNARGVGQMPERVKLYRRPARESEVGALVDIPILLAERSNRPRIIMLFMNFLSINKESTRALLGSFDRGGRVLVGVWSPAKNFFAIHLNLLRAIIYVCLNIIQTDTFFPTKGAGLAAIAAMGFAAVMMRTVTRNWNH
jgi:hypothetical protein